MHWAPSVAVSISASTEGGLELAGKVREEARVLPVGHARQQDALEVREDLLERLAMSGRRRGQLRRDRARPHLRPHRMALDSCEIIRHPVDQRVAVAAKLLQVHGVPPKRRGRSRSWLPCLAREMSSMDEKPQSPRIGHLSSGRLEVEGQGAFKDAKLCPGGAREWDWRESGTRHVPGIQPADVLELLEHGAEVVVLAKGALERLQSVPNPGAAEEPRDPGPRSADRGGGQALQRARGQSPGRRAGPFDVLSARAPAPSGSSADGVRAVEARFARADRRKGAAQRRRWPRG